MIYRQEGDWHRLVRVTGPFSHCLSLLLTEGRSRGPVTVEALTLRGRPCALPEETPEIVEEIEAGVDEANRELGTHFGVERVQFVADEPFRSGVYQLMAAALVRRAAGAEEQGLAAAAG